MSVDVPVKRRRWFRYSLRTLFLLTTAAALGLGWWRAPYVDETVHDVLGAVMQVTSDETVFWLPEEEARKPCEVTLWEVATLRRTFLGDPIRDGPRQFFYRDLLVAEQTWVEGVLHGPFMQWSMDGELEVAGQYEQGLRHGAWTVSKVDNSSQCIGFLIPESIAREAPTVAGFSGVMEPAKVADNTFRYEHGHCVAITKTVRGPEGELELATRYYTDDDSPWGSKTFSETWTHDRRARLEQCETTRRPGIYESRQRGWYATGEKRYEAEPGHRGKFAWVKYWDRRGALVHDVVLQQGRVVADGHCPVFDVLSSPKEPRFTCGTGLTKCDLVPPESDKLYDQTAVFCTDCPLDQFLAKLAAAHRLQLLIDHEALAVTGVPTTANITIATRGLPLHSSLAVAFRPHRLTLMQLHGLLYVTTFDRAPWKAAESQEYQRSMLPQDDADSTGMWQLCRSLHETRPIWMDSLWRAVKLPVRGTLPEYLKVIAFLYKVPVVLRHDQFPAGHLQRRTATLPDAKIRIEEALCNILFQTGAKAVLEDGQIVIVPREPLTRGRPLPVFKDPFEAPRP